MLKNVEALQLSIHPCGHIFHNQAFCFDKVMTSLESTTKKCKRQTTEMSRTMSF